MLAQFHQPRSSRPGLEMTAMLRVAEAFTLRSQAVIDTFGILAVPGAGKSNAAPRWPRRMFKAKLPFIVIDPVRTWWGLSLHATGSLQDPVYRARCVNDSIAVTCAPGTTSDVEAAYLPHFSPLVSFEKALDHGQRGRAIPHETPKVLVRLELYGQLEAGIVFESPNGCRVSSPGMGRAPFPGWNDAFGDHVMDSQVRIVALPARRARS